MDIHNNNNNTSHHSTHFALQSLVEIYEKSRGNIIIHINCLKIDIYMYLRVNSAGNKETVRLMVESKEREEIVKLEVKISDAEVINILKMIKSGGMGICDNDEQKDKDETNLENPLSKAQRMGFSYLSPPQHCKTL